MQKLMFLDFRELEVVRRFERRLQRPRKYSKNPLFTADRPWENGNMQFYGSVVKAGGKPFQLWYSTVDKPWCIRLGYAESEDGIQWERPELDFFKYQGKKTNLLLTDDVHGAAVIYDEADPDPERRYKLVAGMRPSACVKVMLSSDGMRWRELARDPQIAFNPDCPMAFLRKADGRYAVHHRVRRWGRRICRSESFDLAHWEREPRMVFEPGPDDPPQTQFYGMGSIPYGPYELGTLWVFNTDEKELGGGHMGGYQEAELTYSRNGYAWHRAAQGTPFIPHGGLGRWDSGNLQCASQPVFLDDEIRYYYAGTDMRHRRQWELEPQTAGLGMARLKPDRFVALETGQSVGELLTVAFVPRGERLYVNAATGKDGWVKVALLDAEGRELEGFGDRACAPVDSDSTAHPVRWKGDPAVPMGKPVRIRVRARNAKLFSVYLTEEGETPVYHRFTPLW